MLLLLGKAEYRSIPHRRLISWGYPLQTLMTGLGKLAL
jgi:hypothetical protein